MPVSKSNPSVNSYFPDMTSDTQSIAQSPSNNPSSQQAANSGSINTGAGRSMETLVRRGSLGSPSIDSAPTEARNNDILKRGQIHITPSTYLQHKGLPPTKDRLKTFADTYELPFYMETLKTALLLPENGAVYDELKQGRGKHMVELHKNMVNLLNAEGAGEVDSTDYNAVLADMEELTTSMNDILSRISQVPELYAPTGPRTWANQGEALHAVQDMFHEDAQPIIPDDRTLPTIPTIYFSRVAKEFPVSLFRLIRDIHASQVVGKVFDERSQDEMRNRTINSDTAGSLRSIHLNDKRSLPPLINFQVPSVAQPLHNHYRQTSRFPNNLDSPTSPRTPTSPTSPTHATTKTSPSSSRKNSVATSVPGRRASGSVNIANQRRNSARSITSLPPSPLGWAEYTGTGIESDKHNSKIVLAYKDGDMFLTLSHYGFYKLGPNKTYENLGQRYRPEEGVKNPWIKIDMDR